MVSSSPNTAPGVCLLQWEPWFKRLSPNPPITTTFRRRAVTPVVVPLPDVTATELANRAGPLFQNYENGHKMDRPRATSNQPKRKPPSQRTPTKPQAITTSPGHSVASSRSSSVRAQPAPTHPTGKQVSGAIQSDAPRCALPDSRPCLAAALRPRLHMLPAPHALPMRPRHAELRALAASAATRIPPTPQKPKKGCDPQKRV